MIGVVPLKRLLRRARSPIPTEQPPVPAVSRSSIVRQHAPRALGEPTSHADRDVSYAGGDDRPPSAPDGYTLDFKPSSFGSDSDSTGEASEGRRFPVLESLNNIRPAFADHGFQRFSIRRFPFALAEERKLFPHFKWYIHTLYNLDPVRFNVRRISRRYFLAEKTVHKILSACNSKEFIGKHGLALNGKIQRHENDKIDDAKEDAFAQQKGYKLTGDTTGEGEEDLPSSRKYQRSFDYVQQQSIEVESMSAYPMAHHAKRKPVWKKVDVDVVVSESKDHRIINWIDPKDKVQF